MCLLTHQYMRYSDNGQFSGFFIKSVLMPENYLNVYAIDSSAVVHITLTPYRAFLGVEG